VQVYIKDLKSGKISRA
ncbi:hypothetical protein, partial [Candidatus Pseudothioglobus singularis]